MEAGERGRHLCDDCLIAEGFHGYNYMQSERCGSCREDEMYPISLKAEKPRNNAVCDKCLIGPREDDAESELPFDELEDEHESRFSRSSVEKGRKLYETAPKFKERENERTCVYHQIDISMDTLGSSHSEPENIFARIYEIETDAYMGRVITYDLIEIDPEKLEHIGIDQIKPTWKLWTLMTYSSDPEDEIAHSEIYECNPEGLNALYAAATKLSKYVLDALKQGRTESYIQNGQLETCRTRS